MQCIQHARPLTGVNLTHCLSASGHKSILHGEGGGGWGVSLISRDHEFWL